MELLAVLAALVATVVGVYFASWQQRRYSQAERERRQKIADLEVRAREAPPDKVRPAWELARENLEAYFQRNLRQVSQVFWITVSVLLVGFALVAFGVARAISDPNELAPSVIAGGSGALTEFIGATFFFVYRSVMNRAGSHMQILERINTVGMAVQILDAMPSDRESTALTNQTRAEVAKLLLSNYQPGAPYS